MSTLEHRTSSRRLIMDRIREEQGVVAVMRWLLAENLADLGQMRLIVSVSAEATDPAHPAHDYFVRRYETMHEDLRRSFSDEQTRGRSNLLDPGSAATLLISIADGLQLQYLLRSDMDLLAEYDLLTRPLIRPLTD